MRVLSKEELREAFYRLFCEYFKPELETLAYEGKKSLVVDEAEISRIDANLVDYLLDNPKIAFYEASRALREIDLATGVVEYLRLKNIGRSLNVSDIRISHDGKLWQFEGIVRKATNVYPVITKSVWECMKCGGEFSKIEIDNPFKLPERRITAPLQCEQCGRKSKMILLKDKCERMNYQKIEIQESLETVAQPQSIEVYLFDDMAGGILPGDRVKIVGIVDTDHIWKGGYLASSSMKYVVIAVYAETIEKAFEEIELTRKDIEEIKKEANSPDIYKKFVSSIAPSLYGMNDIKEAVMLQLFGGVPKHLPDGTRIRGDIHILLVGDPSTAKSQLLRYVQGLSPKGVYTSGRGATGAGLTATVEKSTSTNFGEGKWVIEAGALVLADMGIACIDELDKMASKDRESIHNAMEQQIVTVDKAGVHAILKARCAILGACNPKFGRFDEYAPIADQINLPPELLSRFDLIFTLVDKPDAERDNMMAEHILNLHTDTEFIKPVYSPDFIRKYISYAKKYVKPKLNEDAYKVIHNFYMSMRKMAKDSTIPITPRYLEALIRLAEASARVRLSSVATKEDAERACRLMKKCLRIVETESAFDIDMIETGIPKTKKDKVRRIYEIIRDICMELNGRPAPKEEIVVRAEEEGISKEVVEELLDLLIKNGRIFEPKYGMYKPTSM